MVDNVLISQLPAASALTNADLVEVEQGADPTNTSGKATLAAIKTFVGGVQSIVAGTNVTVDATDPSNPIVASTGGGGGGVGSQIGYTYVASSTLASITGVIPFDNTIPQITEGDAYASVDTTYTPIAATSLLEIEIMIGYAGGSATGQGMVFALFRDSTANAIAATRLNWPGSGYTGPVVFRAIVAAVAIAATTFKLRVGVSSGTGYILRDTTGANFGGTSKVTMTIREIAQ